MQQSKQTQVRTPGGYVSYPSQSYAALNVSSTHFPSGYVTGFEAFSHGIFVFLSLFKGSDFPVILIMWCCSEHMGFGGVGPLQATLLGFAYRITFVYINPAASRRVCTGACFHVGVGPAAIHYVFLTTIGNNIDLEGVWISFDEMHCLMDEFDQ